MNPETSDLEKLKSQADKAFYGLTITAGLIFLLGDWKSGMILSAILVTYRILRL